MDEEVFEPKNELEHRLLAAIAGEITSDEFRRELMEAQLFMPIQDEESSIKGFQRSTRAKPLVIQDEEGINVLVLFTSPERAREFVRNFPGFGGGLLAEFKWVLERMDAGAGITVNPGWEAGIDMEPETVSEMILELANHATKN